MTNVITREVPRTDVLSTPVALGATPLSVNRFNDISYVLAMIYST